MAFVLNIIKQPFMKKLSAFLLLHLLVAGSLFSQYNPQGYFPQDTAVIKGTLKNGLTYYIRKNGEPQNRASFYIIRNAGALLEEDHENGLAHFLEHMAFNGTKNFPDKGIINTLERYGVAFGRNLNAYTSLDETVYNISDVPTNVPLLMDTSLLILKDWTYYLTLDGDAIDEERGVITEEWRQGRNASTRIREQTLPVIAKGSRFAERDVIGSMDVIQNFPHQDLRDFYHRWYRTDLTALVIVGDFDAREMERKVISVFSDVPAEKNPKPLPRFDIPSHQEIYYVLATDKEVRSSNVQLITMIPEEVNPEDMTQEYFRNSMVEGFYNTLISHRIGQMQLAPNPPFLSGSIGTGNFARGYNTYSLATGAKPNEEEAAFRAILTENERVKRYGFLESELDRAKTNMLARLESSYKQRDKTRNDSFVGSLKSNFLTGSPIVDAEVYYNFAREVIPTITAAEVSAKAHEWNGSENRTIIVTGPEDVRHLTREEALNIMREVENDPGITPYTEEVALSESLIDTDLPGSPVVSQKELPQFQAVEWTLANGAKVVFRKADYEKDRVALASHSPGGTSLYDIDMLPAASNASNLVTSFGKGNFDPVTLGRMLTGKLASVRASIGALSESVSGSSSPQDFETMMQLVYMTFEQPRFDEALYENSMDRSRISLQNRHKNPQSALQDSLSLILSDYHPRTLLFNEEYLNAMSLEKVKEVYLDRIKDASDFTFFIVGNIEADEARPLVEKYIGSIKSYHRNETWRDNNVPGFSGKVEKRIGADMQEPKSTVFLHFKQNAEITPERGIAMGVLSQIMTLRYTESIREKEGGTYGVRVGANSSRLPQPVYTLEMSFDCEPQRAEELKALLYKGLEEMIENGPDAEELDKVLVNMRKEREQSKPHNSYWMNVIYNYYQTGINNDDPKNFEDILDNLTPRDIQQQAKTFIENASVADIIFYPNE